MSIRELHYLHWNFSAFLYYLSKSNIDNVIASDFINTIGSIQLYNKNDEMDTLGRVYEYFLGEFAQQEDNLVIQKFKE